SPEVPSTMGRARCYKTDMGGKNKALPWALLLLVLSGAPSGCSSAVGGKSGPQMVKAEDGGEEEVLTEDNDLDAYGRPKTDGTEAPGGFLVSAGYVAMSIGSALLPFLFLL